jgi:hypothetical protein
MKRDLFPFPYFPTQRSAVKSARSENLQFAARPGIRGLKTGPSAQRGAAVESNQPGRGFAGPNSERTMPKKKKAAIPRLVVPRNATLRQIYATARREFTASDLQKYTEIEPMVPMEEVLAQMEKAHQQEARRRRKK